ncbi:MAG: MscL family protein [Synergistaceae bacterium]|nr:MscL family protein [Synergistaceae bacterium]
MIWGNAVRKAKSDRLLVSDILMPPIGMLLGGVDFSGLFINLSGTHIANLADAKAANLPVIAYGVFLNTVIYFLIQAGAVFVLIRFVNKLTPPKPSPVPKRKCPFCISEIDDNATRCPHCTSQL